MCGIVGYVGTKESTPLLLEGLRRLEYRGYDSAGVATMNGGGVEMRRAAGKIAKLEQAIAENPTHGSVGIAHTRWATHGPPNEKNAHPHMDEAKTIAVVHNGIIENSSSLKKSLEARGHVFSSDTDTEVLSHLIEELFDGSLEDAVVQALKRVEGTYGIAVISSRDKDKIVAARKGSPLLIGIGKDEWFVASDVSAILAHTREVVYLEDGDVAVLTRTGFRVIDHSQSAVTKVVSKIDWDIDQIERGGYAHFMLKEIFEQPVTVENTMRGRMLQEEGTAKLGGLNLTDEQLLKIDNIIITACGTSWHSALIGEYLIEEMARIPVEVEYASEFRYRNPVVDEHTLVIAISQSGETADTLAAIREAKRRGARTLGLVNVVGSSIAREVDGGLYLRAGPEVGVASTKAFTSQVVTLALVALRIGRLRNLSILQGREFIHALQRLPEQIREILAKAPELEKLAERFKHSGNALFLGRGVNFPTALEGALKLKEISYVHAEGYPAAEMKHGPIALIDEQMPVVFVAPQDAVYGKVVSNMEEVRARGGRIIAVVNECDATVTGLSDTCVSVPKTHDLLTPILAIIPLQLFSYHVAVKRGCNVDQPRNLAKSVTVE